MVPALALLVALSTVTLLFYSGISRAPAAFIGDDDKILLTPPSGGLTSSGVVSGSLADVLRQQEGVKGVSPEIFVPTSIGGRSAIVRGVQMDVFLSMERGTLISGRLALGDDEAIAGGGFTSRHDIQIGDEVVVAGSIGQAVLTVKVVGIFETKAASRDELFVTLDAARALAGLTGDAVHLLRIDASNKTAIARLVDSIAPVFLYSGVSISHDRALVGDTITVRANLTNWGAIGGTKRVELHESGRLVASEQVYVPARAQIHIEIPFEVDRAGELNITLNPSFHVTAAASSAMITAKTVAPLGGPFPVHVAGADGQAIAGADILAAGEHTQTDADGNAMLHPPRNGPYEIRAEIGGKPLAKWRGYVVDADDLDSARVMVLGLTTTAPLVRSNETFRVNVTLANLGGVAEDLRVNVTVNGAPAGTVLLGLGPGDSGSQIILIGPLAAGIHEVSVEGHLARLEIESIDGDPAVEAILRANRRAEGLVPAIPHVDSGADDYISRVVGNVRLAVIVLSIVSAALASMGALAVVGRHVADRTSAIGLLKAIGADREYVLQVVSREAAIYGAWASLAGIIGGTLVTLALDATHILTAFGHAVRPRYDVFVLLLLAGGTILFVAVSSRLITSATFARPVDQLIRGETLRRGHAEAPPLVDLFRGRP